MRMKALNIVVTLLAIVGGLMHATAASFTVQAPRQVIQGNKFTVTYTLKDAEGTALKVDQIEGATLIFGPATGQSSSYQFINGKQTSSFSTSYTYTYRADKPGTYKVEGASINVDGKTVSTNSFSIEILPPDKSASTNGGTQSQSAQIDNIDSRSASKPIDGKDLFVRINLSKSSAYEQEAIVCSIKLYTKYEINSFMPTLQPSFNGFLIEDLPITAQLNSIEHINGENYMVAELKRCILYPQQSGTLTITSGNYDLSVIQYEQQRSFFGIIRTPVERELKVKSNSASVNVRPLPEPKPAGFSGAVGTYKISSKLGNTKFKTYEAATYSITISGTGNIKYLKAPVVDFPSQFEVYDPQAKSNISPNGGNMSGTSTWEYTFSPQYVGDFTIPAVNFCYFNINSKKYETVSTEAMTLHVDKGNGAPTSSRATAKTDVVQKNTDILHIKTGNLKLTHDNSLTVSTFIYWLWYILPTLILIAILIIYRKNIKARSNVKLMRTKKAGKVAKKRLRQAKAYMQAHDSSNFHAEILKALWGYLSDKIGIPVSNLSKENIALELGNYGATAELTDEILKILDECEFAQYAPAQSDSQMESLYNSTSEAMDKLENTKKK